MDLPDLGDSDRLVPLPDHLIALDRERNRHAHDPRQELVAELGRPVVALAAGDQAPVSELTVILAANPQLVQDR